MNSDVNIVKVASLIRGQNKCQVKINATVDLNDIKTIEHAIECFVPDIIVNSSRAYSGLKYGSFRGKQCGLMESVSFIYTIYKKYHGGL